ncbi:acyltransferase [Marilutibacter aestuarii]|uniref:Acyltransferase n=1 Tax=Marilutibacter aestuarii TaxID=1706195 RepID=A0A508AMG1_9GAMM|nr:acyltransferase [Lysobacter aestuarii]TQD51310.1 acyltransferase [Lysobacter aestuarii]
MSVTHPVGGEHGGDWTRRPEGGGRFAIWLIQVIARRLGRAPARALLYPITLYFLIMRGPERRASRAYLGRVLGRPAGLLDVARHIHTFASTILDRVFLLGGRMDSFDIRTHGLDALHEVLDRGRGVLLFGSHLGSFDGLRALATQRPNVPVRVVLDKQHNPAITQLLDALNPTLARNIIDAAQDGPSIVLAIQQAASEGAIVAILADRARPGEPTVSVPFIDAPAPFPTAPWLIAAVLELPVVLAFGLYRGGRHYDLVFEAFSEGLAAPRRQRAEAMPAWIARYALRLEHHARQAPYNWFNFYDFWQVDDAKSASNARPVPPAR